MITMVVRSFAVIKNEGKFLLIREATIRWKNKWFVPGGKITPHESIVSGTLRECREESGYEAGLNGIFFIQHFSVPPEDAGLYLFFSGRIISGKLKDYSNEHSIEAGWFDMHAIEQMELRKDLHEVLKRYSDDVPLFSAEQLQLL